MLKELIVIIIIIIIIIILKIYIDIKQQFI